MNWQKVKVAKTIFEDLGEQPGEVKTDLMLHLYPEWVLPLSEAGDGAANKNRFKALYEGWVWTERR